MFRHSYSSTEYAQNYVLKTGKMFAKEEKKLNGKYDIPPYDKNIIREHGPNIEAEKKQIYTIKSSRPTN